MELRCQGWTYAAIIEELGYASRGTAHTVVHTALAAQEPDKNENLREWETERLDQLQQAVWTPAMSGDVAAITEGRRIIEAGMRLLGLVEKAAQARRGSRTVVCSCAPGTGHRAVGIPGS